MAGGVRVISNHQAVIKTIQDVKSHIGFPMAVQTLAETSALVIARAKELAHIGPDPTYPRGRPHTIETIRLQPLNQFATRVLANHGGFWEELRGGDHAFLSNAVAQITPQALDRFTQHGLRVIEEARRG